LKLTDIITRLFTPRRSFAYRQLEAERDREVGHLKAQLARMREERDDYKEQWISAVNYGLQLTGKPRLNIGDQPPPPKPPLMKITPAAIEAKYKDKHDRNFREFLAAEKARGTAPNDINYDAATSSSPN
jgi:hypothetical protein